MNIKINRNIAVKIGIGIAAIIVVLWLISLAGQILATLVPFAIAALVAFVAYQYLTRRSKTKEEKTSDKTAATSVTSAAVGMVASQVANSVGKAFQSLQSDESEAQEETRVEVEVEEDVETGVDPTTITADDLDELVAKPINISRLEAKENNQPKVTDEVLAQIEERRKRLMGGGES